MTIPLLRPSCTQAEIDAVTEVLKSGWWGQGAVVEQFEIELAKKYGYKYCVTTNSATAALHLAVKVSGIGPRDEVILPALTFVSTALAISYCGGTPVFADVNPRTLCMDWRDALSKRTNRTKLFMPVDYAGYPALRPPELDLPIVQDAAHSCGGMGYGQMVCLSFHPVKNLATGDGGAILTNNPEQAQELRALRWCGINKSTWDRSKTRYGWDYDIRDIGYKAHWNDIQAAIGLAQLHRLDDINAERWYLAHRYTELLGDYVETPPDCYGHTWHLYVIRVPAGKRDHIIDTLKAHDISAGVHYKPLTYYPMYQQETPPITEREWRKLITLPLFCGLTTEDQDRIVEIVLSCL